MKRFVVKYVLNGLKKILTVCAQKVLYSAVILGFSP